MPIANCIFVSASDDPDAQAIVSGWSAHSGIDPDEMTINVLHARQGGKPYAVMAWLYVPSLWSADDVIALGEGLAAAVADVVHVPSSSVQVLTSIVTSGLVVESGASVRW